MKVQVPEVRGITVDVQTRCAHYHSAVDVIAIKMACCGVYYACAKCHAALADHASFVWPRSAWNSHAVLCGVCYVEMTIYQYMQCGYRCPHCSADFNPRCGLHWHSYFAVDEGAD